MKFLKNVDPKTKNVMPISFNYYNAYNYKEDDVLTITYKDLDNNKIIVENITKPEIEIYIIKPEFRQQYMHPNGYMPDRDYIPIEHLKIYRVNYRNRYREIAKILNLNSIDAAKVSPLVMYSNKDIRNYYAEMFAIEYGFDGLKPLNCAFLDIENDTIKIHGFPDPGETPINALTIVDDSGSVSYTLLLRSKAPSNIINPDTGKIFDNRDQIEYLENNIDKFIEKCHENFDESYGHLDYNIKFFDNEIDMIKTAFQILELSDVDMCMIWNLPYEMSNFIERCKVLGFVPSEILCSDKFKVKEATFVEDRNPVAHKRKHNMVLSHPTVMTCQMQNYSGVRAGRGVIPSLKLGNIAKIVLGDEKLNYEEHGDIRTLAYLNYEMFVLYNIKDVLLQLGIHRKTRDIDMVYEIVYSSGLVIHQAFTTTDMLVGDMTIDFYRQGYIICNNKNKKNTKAVHENNMNGIMKAFDDLGIEYDIEDFEYEEEEEEEEDSGKKKKKKKIPGAVVGNPNRVLSTGTIINDSLNDKIHDDAVDLDATSLYPSLARLMNLSNETMIARIEFVNDIKDYFDKLNRLDEFNSAYNDPLIAERLKSEYLKSRIPMYNYTFIDDEESEYSINMSDIVGQMIASDSIEELGEIVCNLPSFDELDKMIMGVSV